MNKLISTEYRDLIEVAKVHKREYSQGVPFPNIYIENFFDLKTLNNVLHEFPDLSKGNHLQFDNNKEKKFAGDGESKFGIETKRLMHFLNSHPFLEFLQELTGIEEILIGDPYYFGGGLHEIKKGGYLKIHTDFNKHKYTKLDRRLNVLIYLNKDWDESFGGHFELWNKDMTYCEKKICPNFNTMAIFSTTSNSFHGHPDPLNCSDDRSRKSLALYYYTNGRPQEEIDSNNASHGTLFKERPTIDNFKLQDEKKINKWKGLLIDFIPPIVFKLKNKLMSL